MNPAVLGFIIVSVSAGVIAGIFVYLITKMIIMKKISKIEEKISTITQTVQDLDSWMPGEDVEVDNTQGGEK